MYAILLLSALIALSASLSIPLSFSDASSSASDQYLRRRNRTIPQRWPSAPYRAKIANNIYLVINNYMPPASLSLQSFVLTNITAIEAEIENAGNPGDFVDNTRVFSHGHVIDPLSDVSTGLVSVRFPAVQPKHYLSLPRITNALAVQVLAATWTLEKEYGPRGFSFAMIEVGGKPWSYFSLWLSQLR